MHSNFLDVNQPAKIKPTPLLAYPNAAICGTILSIGIFFDGTGNNHNHYSHAEDTNVWKLSRAYAADNKEVFAYYVSGVGTPFIEIGKTTAEFQGGSTGNGGEARIIFALLQIFNAVHLVLTVVGTGHNDWGNAEDLRIHPKVKNCVHYVALHELRTSFPSDSVMQGSTMPDNCQEHLCPGVHSDVGGGYAAGAQGKGVRLEYDRRYDTPKAIPFKSDGMRLSNVPLNAMYKAAELSTHGHYPRPWLDLRSSKDLIESFGLEDLPAARAAVQTYLDKCGITKGLDTYKALREHGELYLAWRYQVNEQKGFEKLKSVAYAKELDPKGLLYYREGQKIFAAQVDKLSGKPRFLDQLKQVFMTTAPGFALAAWLVDNQDHPKAREIFMRIQKITVASEVGQFFDEWVHDSYAGFIGKMVEDAYFKKVFKVVHSMAERQGYIRWRQAYQGSTKGVNTAIAPANDDTQSRTA